MADTAYDIGDRVEFTGTFTNAAGALANPTTVVFKVRRPSGTIVTVAATNPSVGVFKAQVTLTEAGLHHWNWLSTGDPTTADEGSFYVRRTAFA